MRLYIIRHADPDYPNNTITPAGHLEAQVLAPRMARLKLDRIYSSPLGRALHTAEYTAKATGLPIAIEPWMEEIPDFSVDLPPWGKCPAWDVPGEVVRRQRVTHEHWHTHPAFTRDVLSTKFAHIQSCSDEFLARHGYGREPRDNGCYRIIAPNTERIAVFCHNGFGLTWLAHLLEIPLPVMWTSFWMAPTGITTVLFDERSKEFAVPRCLNVNDVSHVEAAGLPTSTRGIKANFE